MENNNSNQLSTVCSGLERDNYKERVDFLDNKKKEILQILKGLNIYDANLIIKDVANSLEELAIICLKY